MAYYNGELLKQNFAKALNEFEGLDVPMIDVAIKFGQAFRNTPTADVQETKHGKWEHKIQEIGIFKHHYIACPCCAAWFNIVNVHLLIGDGKLFDFCPSCGAKMDKE